MAGNTRFHSKYHYAQHHSEVTLKNSIYPDAATDPIASFTLPFQGDFHSDGVLKITSVDPSAFNYFGNDVFIDRDLYVTNNTSITGDLEVVGNVVLKANPKYSNPQRITIGDDKAGPLSAIDLVHFGSYIDSDFSPDASHEHNLGEPDRRWDWIYASNLNINGSFKVGTCAKDGEVVDRGLYIDLLKNVVDPIQPGMPTKARLGVNECEPNRELDIVGSVDVHGNVKLDNNRYVFWDSLSAAPELSGNATDYQHTKACGLSGDSTRLTAQHPAIIDLNAPEINTQAYDVNVVLKDSQNAMTLGTCLIHLDELNDRVGIHNCTPREDLDITSNVLIEGLNFTAHTNQTLLSGAFVDIDTSNVTKIKSPTTMTEGARVFINANQYVKINTPEIDMSDQPTAVVLDDKTVNVENCMLVLNGSNRSVGVNVCDPQHPLDVDGVANFRGPIRSQNATIDETINENQVIYKDTVTHAHTTTLGFYYDGVRAGIGHLPLSGEDARLYVGNGPIKLASVPGNVLTVDSSKQVILDANSTMVLDSTVFTSPDDHNIVFDLSNENENSCFAIRTSDELTPGVYSGDASAARFVVKPQASRDRAFFGLNTTDNTPPLDDSSGKTDEYDVIMDQDVNVTNGLRVGNWLHVEDDATVDGKIVVNSEEETAGIVVNSGRIDLVETIGGTDYAMELGSRTNLTELRSTAEIPGTASSHGSTISSATNDHMVIDLRNTDQDQRFAIRYSSDNSGISDKIVFTAGHYIYQIANPDYDDGQPVSLDNPQFIDETRQGHVGVNCIPTQGYHLDVNGNMRITGDFYVDGASTTIAAANMTVQDKNIVLNDGGTTAASNNAGIYIEGDNNTVVGYWKVHPTDIDKLVAKAPTGQEIMFDINGTTTSSLTMHDSDVNLKNSTFDLTSSAQGTPATFNLQYIGNTVDGRAPVQASVNIVDSAIDLSNSTLDMDGDLTVSGDSSIDQDLTQASSTALFDGLTLDSDLTIPVGAAAGSTFNGSIRFNPTSGAYEGYIESGTDGAWTPFNGLLADADGDTYITPENTADSDQLEFYTDGTLAMKITKTQGVDISKLLLGGTAITATAGELNMTDVATVGQSANSKVLTQSSTGTIKIGASGANQTLDIASHDGTDGGLKLAGTLVTSTASQLNYVDVTKGTVVANKAVVVDKNKSVSGYNVVGCKDLKATGEVHSSSTSDERLKLNLKRISKPLKKLNKISGYTFDWDSQAAAVSELAGADVGVVAQEVEKVVPEAVVNKESGFKGVKYEKLIPLLIECIKDQQTQIADLQERIKDM